MEKKTDGKEECNIFKSMARIEQRTIGVIGVAPGMGVTHLVIALADYSVSCRRRKTAVVELSGNHAIEKLTGTREPFEWNRIMFYPDFPKSRVAELRNGDYEVVIFDMGSCYYSVRTEFLYCDRKLVLGSLAPWRKADYYNFVQDEMEEDRYARGVVFLERNGIKKEKKEFLRQLGQPVYSIPFLQELRLEKDQQNMFDGIVP